MSAGQDEAVDGRPAGWQGQWGTGLLKRWFGPWHPEFGPCCKCGIETDRWFIGASSGSPVRSTLHILEAWPFCERCERRADIVRLEQRQLNLEIYPEQRAREAVYLAELKVAEANVQAILNGVPGVV